MATVRRENGGLTLQEKKEVQAVFDHACTWQEKLETLAEDFDKKGYFGLMWDSKVPEKDKWFFYFFTFRSSNKDDVNAEIQKYVDFYREMSEVANQMMNNSEETSQRDKDACQLVKELREHLMKLSRAAESGEETTDSSTVYRLHREFIDKHEKLEHLIKKVECVALNQSREMVMEQSQKKIEQMKTDLKKSEKRFTTLCDKFDKLLTKYEYATEENNSMALQNRQLLEKSTDQKEQLEALKKEKAEMARRNQRLEDRHEDVCDKFQKLMTKYEEVTAEKRTVEQANNEMELQNRQLLEKSNDLEEQLAKSEDRHKDVCEKFNQLFAKYQEVRNDSGIGVQEVKNNSIQEELERLKREKRELVQIVRDWNRRSAPGN